MAATGAVAILAFAAMATLISGTVLALHRFLFIAKSYRVIGKVESEWNYRMAGLQMRYYRVGFCLSNGQSTNLRSGVTSSMLYPKVGETVPVLVREGAGNVRARIGTTSELWFEVFVLLFIGSVGSIALLSFAYKVFPG